MVYEDKVRELVLAARAAYAAWQDVEEEDAVESPGYILISAEDLAPFTSALDALDAALDTFAAVRP